MIIYSSVWVATAVSPLEFEMNIHSIKILTKTSTGRPLCPMSIYEPFLKPEMLGGFQRVHNLEIICTVMWQQEGEGGRFTVLGVYSFLHFLKELWTPKRQVLQLRPL